MDGYWFIGLLVNLHDQTGYTTNNCLVSNDDGVLHTFQKLQTKMGKKAEAPLMGCESVIRGE